MEKLEKFLNKYLWLVIVGLSVPAVWALFVRGYFGAHDDLHIAWLYEMDRVVKIFQIPPRFVPDLSYGFGYPLFNFVFPLPYYLGEVFHLLGLSLVDSIKTILLLSVPFSMYFMFLLLSEFASVVIALAGAVLYVYSPYRATDIFVRGAVGEVVAFVFLPLVLLSFVKLKEKSFKWLVIAGFSTAALIMSHNIIAYMFFPFLLAYLVATLFLYGKSYFPILKRYFSGLILGLLLSLYFWLPAIVESKLMKYSTVYDFIDHFPTIRQLITPYFGYGASVPGPGDGLSFFVGSVSLVAIFIGVALLIKYFKAYRGERKLLVIWALAAVVISIFMMNFRSTFIWKTVPLLPYFQFPWRFLTMVSFAAPLLLVTLTVNKKGPYVGLVIIFSAIALNFAYFRPEDFFGRRDDYYLNRYIPVPVASTEYKKISEDYLRLPVGTQVQPKENYPLVSLSDGVIKNTVEINPLAVRVQTESDKEAVLNYNKYYFPGWIAKIDGGEVKVETGKPFGQVAVVVPPGAHSVEIAFRETNFRRILNFISLGAAVISLYLLFRARREK